MGGSVDRRLKLVDFPACCQFNFKASLAGANKHRLVAQAKVAARIADANVVMNAVPVGKDSGNRVCPQCMTIIRIHCTYPIYTFYHQISTIEQRRWSLCVAVGNLDYTIAIPRHFKRSVGELVWRAKGVGRIAVLMRPLTRTLHRTSTMRL